MPKERYGRGGRSPPEEKKDDKDKRKEPYVPKSKLRTDGVTELLYDRFSATSFTNFERDLKMVAGQEYGELFGYVIQGEYPPDKDPQMTSFKSVKKKKMAELKEPLDHLLTINVSARSTEEDEEIEELETKLEALEKFYQTYDQDDINLVNRSLEKKYDQELKEVSEKRRKMKENSPKLYWLIRKNLSDLSLRRRCTQERP